MRRWYVIGLIALLAGCQSSKDEGRCSGYGFIQGTNEFANCMQRIDMAREYHKAKSNGSAMYDD